MDLLYPLRYFHGKIYETKNEYEKMKSLYNRIISLPRSTLLFVLTPTHGNLGDHAIAYSTELLFKSIDVAFLEVTIYELSLLNKYNKLSCMNGRPIVVNGGGNIGTLWPELEYIFRRVIQCNPDSAILCLPNTAYFEKSAHGRKEFENSQRIYNSHSRLQICARETFTYDLMKPCFNNVVLIPDLVLSLDLSGVHTYRKGCMVCLRNDKERTLSNEQEQKLLEQVTRLFGDDVIFSDMETGEKITANQRQLVLDSKFQEFQSVELVITDRLHGMIFSAVTGTPCIVVDSKSPKVKGCYDWIKRLEYIYFIKDVNSFEDIYSAMPKRSFCYDNYHLLKYYEKLKWMIINLGD